MLLLLLLCQRTPAEETVPPYELETLEQSAVSAGSRAEIRAAPSDGTAEIGAPTAAARDGGQRLGLRYENVGPSTVSCLFKRASTISLDRREGSGCGCYNLAFSLTGLQKSLRSSSRSFMIQGHGTYGLAYTPQFSMQPPLLGLLILVA